MRTSHRYNYVNQNPVNGVDPEGLEVVPSPDLTPAQLAYFKASIANAMKTAKGRKLLAGLSGKDYKFVVRANPKVNPAQQCTVNNPSYTQINPATDYIQGPGGQPVLRPGTYYLNFGFDIIGTDPNAKGNNGLPNWSEVPHECGHAFQALHDPKAYGNGLTNPKVGPYRYKLANGKVVNTSKPAYESYVHHEWEFPILIESGVKGVPIPLP